MQSPTTRNYTLELPTFAKGQPNRSATRRSKIVSRAIATSVDHMLCAAVSFNFTGQSLRLPDECGPCDFGPVS